MTNQLALSNVINVSVASTPTGLSAFNTSNLLLLTADTAGGSFPGAGWKIYLEPTSVGVDFGTSSTTYLMALAVFSQQPNILAAGGYLVIATYISSETTASAIARLEPLVQFYGVIPAQIETQTHMLAAAAVIQASPLMCGFFAQYDPATIASGGALDMLRTGGNTESRGLYYGDSSGSPAGINALLAAAAYAGRALSTNFNGSLTASTMNLKQLATIQPDPTLTQTQYALALAAGADVYASVQGVSAVLCSGTNKFFDQIYNLAWYVGAIEVAGFNYLQAASTKIPQTEDGMDGLKSVYRQVCRQAVTNGYAAPGTWTSPTTFGNQADMLANIAQYGFYIYSQPIAQQLQSARAQREAPLVQIALKEAGALHSSSIIVNINA